jgi:hypothetical protein
MYLLGNTQLTMVKLAQPTGPKRGNSGKYVPARTVDTQWLRRPAANGSI